MIFMSLAMQVNGNSVMTQKKWFCWSIYKFN